MLVNVHTKIKLNDFMEIAHGLCNLQMLLRGHLAFWAGESISKIEISSPRANPKCL